LPKDIVCLRNISINTLHKGDDDDDNDDNNNNKNNTIREIFNQKLLIYYVLSQVDQKNDFGKQSSTISCVGLSLVIMKFSNMNWG
jgi:hypothetical protein